MREAQLQAKIIKLLEAHGYYVRKIINANKSGTPDLLCCSPDGKFIGIEVKSPGRLKNVSKLQQYNLDEISKRGGVALAIDDIDSLIKSLNLS